MHNPLFAETDFVLGGMDIHIHLAVRDVDKQNNNRIASPFHEVSIGAEDGVLLIAPLWMV